MDPFTKNIEGVTNLISSNDNKSNSKPIEEGTIDIKKDVLDLDMEDAELLKLKDIWIINSSKYEADIKPRQAYNKAAYLGKQDNKTTESNLIFEAEETFIPQALSKNPEPVVFSDNTDEGKTMSDDIKTMLQYHSDTLGLKRVLSVTLRHWSIYLIGVIKHGWDLKIEDIDLDIRKPKNFIFDPDAYIDVLGNYTGEYLGEKITITAGKLVKLFPKYKDYILVKANGKLGTPLIYTEWWTDEYCFSTFMDVVLDKHKNEFFNYEEDTTDEFGVATTTQKQNHFARPKMPYSFLSIFSLQEQPHDVTNLVEQAIPSQNRISKRDKQIDKNLDASNNSIALSGISFNSETARQAAKALEDGDPVLVPDGQVDSAIKRLPANNIPNAIFESQNIDKDTLRGIFGTQGLSAQRPNDNTTARGMILNQSHDTSRIGGGVGDALEQLADNIFNWWLQLYCVFYDEDHYASIMGSGRAVNYVKLNMANQDRHYVVSVSPNSMAPKDEISEMNLAKDLANTGWLDPINLFKKLNYADPMETAKMVTMYKLNPNLYFQTYFSEALPAQGPQANPNPLDMSTQTAQEGSTNLSSEPASSSLAQVPLQ